ncbi:endonuclease [Algibacter miyuki]|uniref:Endonuclease n=1 Tax=Algibacter miyuki TaxID=1306933 RepID=A0ABV5H2N9_9FLAO|nr:endonuclease [Algibacter miyuki]MDN3666581.1 endonuclease [Algibacter miyuki]
MKHFYLFFLFITTISFAQLTPPQNLQSYYQDVDFSQTGMDLFNDLAIETAAKHTQYLTYTPGIWEASKITDQDPDNLNNVLLIYGYNDTDGNYVTDRTRSNMSSGGDSGTDWNREHTFPNSLASPKLESTGRDVPPYADAHNLRPSDVTMNSNRGNLKYITNIGTDGQLITTTAANISGSWYPGDEWKGDAARIIMYMYLRYGTQCKPSFVAIGETNTIDPNMINLLLEWNAQDPVSIVENQRNAYHGDANKTYGQGNRNPFIDNPYLATVIWGGQSAINRWGESQPTDTEAPTIPTNLVATNVTSTTVDLSWTPSTDDTGVTSYQIYVDGVYFLSSQSTTTITLTGLNPETTYSFAVLAADLANNKSDLSDAVNATTLEDSTPVIDACITETFENLVSTDGLNNNQYGNRTWTGNDGGSWTASLARIDEVISPESKAITFDVRGTKAGNLTSPMFPGGIGNLTATTQRAYSGGSGNLDVLVNGNVVGSLPYGDSAQTTTISNINITGNVTIVITENTSGGDRVTLDDLSWTCYASLSTDDIFLENLKIYPNPTKGSNINIDTNQPLEFGIYDILGKQTNKGVISSSAKSIDVANLEQGVYILKLSSEVRSITKKIVKQ